jgi:hypothetical protein
MGIFVVSAQRLYHKYQIHKEAIQNLLAIAVAQPKAPVFTKCAAVRTR